MSFRILVKETVGTTVFAVVISIILPINASANTKSNEMSIEGEISNIKPNHKKLEQHKYNSSLMQNEQKHLFDEYTNEKDVFDMYTYGDSRHIKDIKNIIAILFSVVILLSGIYAISDHAYKTIKYRRRRKKYKSHQKYSAHEAEHGIVGGIHTKMHITQKEVEEHWK